MLRTERWVEVPRDHLRLSVMPRSGGLEQFMATLSF